MNKLEAELYLLKAGAPQILIDRTLDLFNSFLFKDPVVQYFSSSQNVHIYDYKCKYFWEVSLDLVLKEESVFVSGLLRRRYINKFMFLTFSDYSVFMRFNGQKYPESYEWNRDPFWYCYNSHKPKTFWERLFG